MLEATPLVSLNQRPGFAPVLWSSCLAMLAVGANSTAIMAALPRMRAELSLGPAGVQWAVNAYLVASAASIVLGGRAADWFGARLGAIAGLALFAAASCIIAVSGGQVSLLAGRSLQGLAAALAVPCTLAAVDAGAAPDRRAQAIGAWTGFLMLGFSIGPLLGGALTDAAGWRAIFWLNALLMLAAMVGMTLSGAAAAHSGRGRKLAVDWIGFILQAAFMAALIFGLQAAPQARAAPFPVIGFMAVAAGSFVMLRAVEARVAAPLIDWSLFLQPDFVTGLAIGSLAMFSIMSLLLYFNLYAQSPQGLALTALEAGLSLVPLSAALLAVALMASAIAARVGLGAAITGAMALIAIACAIVGVAVSGGGSLMLAIGFLAMGAGLALPYASAPRLALSALSPAERGQGSGLVNACTFLGGSFGVAGGAIAFELSGFVAVLAMIALAGVIGAALGRFAIEPPARP
jgi:MFS family permease